MRESWGPFTGPQLKINGVDYMKHPKSYFLIALSLVAVSFISIFICSMFIFQAKQVKSTVNYHNDSSKTIFDKSLFEIRIDDNNELVFYFNKNGNIACTMLEETLFRNKRVFISSEILPHIDELSANILFSTYTRDGKQYWLAWGVAGSKISNVQIGDVYATILSNEQTHIFYIVDQEGELPATLEYKLFDYAGNLISIDR